MDISTRYGWLYDCINVERSKDGSLISCMVQKPSALLVQEQELIPQYHFGEVQRKYIPSVTFRADGSLRTLSLDQRTGFPTPLGNVPAEYLTFYASGKLCRIFPLNSKISAYWSEKEEFSRMEPLAFDLPGTQFKAKIICLHFYESDMLRSLTLAPGEIIQLTSPIGAIQTRIGFALREDGSLESLEPTNGTTVSTPIGSIPAFDPFALGIHADKNSLHFSADGLLSLKTTAAFRIQKHDHIVDIYPCKKPSPLDDNIRLSLPTTVRFSNTQVAFLKEDQTLQFPYRECSFSIH
jgi:hypothetical protein